jgi:hypothetical protein
MAMYPNHAKTPNIKGSSLFGVGSERPTGNSEEPFALTELASMTSNEIYPMVYPSPRPVSMLACYKEARL